MRELLDGLVPGLPGDGRRGDPRAGRRHPALRGRDRADARRGRPARSTSGGVYVPVGDSTDLAVPETLTALIAPGWTPSTRPIGAPPGRGRPRPEFTLAALAAVSGDRRSELEPGCEPSSAASCSTIEIDPRSPERGQYAFVQALIREVAYSTLAKRDRKRPPPRRRPLLRVARDRRAGRRPRGHYLAAYANAGEGAEADALATQARIALKAAAVARQPRSAHTPRRRHYLEQAVAVTSDESEQADLLEQAGTAAQTAGRIADARDTSRRSLDLRVKTGDRNGEARVIGFLGWMLSSSYRADEASELIEPALERLADIEAPEALAWLKSYAASVRVRRNEHASALALIEEALDTAEHLGLMELLARSLLTKSSVLNALGRFREGLSSRSRLATSPRSLASPRCNFAATTTLPPCTRIWTFDAPSS